MNIFALDQDARKAARMHCDKHVLKMIVETAQLLSTAHRVLDGISAYVLTAKGRRKKVWSMLDPQDNAILYKATHVNHPCSVWVRESAANYVWTYHLFVELVKEYLYRYGSNCSHKTWERCGDFLSRLPKNIPLNDGKMTPFRCAITGHPGIVTENPVPHYRTYYKSKVANGMDMRWTKRGIPVFMLSNNVS